MLNRTNSRALSLLQRYQGFAGLGILLLAAFLLQPDFFTPANFENVMNQLAVPGILAIGMTFVIITGGIDLSIGSLLGLLNCIIATWLVTGATVGLAIAYALLIGTVVGALLGVIVSYSRMQPFIVTLAAMVSLRGIAFIYTHHSNVSGLSTQLDWAGVKHLGLPTAVWLLIGATLIAMLLLRTTTFGRYVYALGGSEEAARYAGVPINRTRILAYAVNGLCVALAAVLFTARSNAGEPGAGIGYELDAITAVVVGGCSLFGGTGSVGGTFLGALFIVCLNVLVILQGVDFNVGQGLKGVIILIAVYLQNLGRR